MKTQKNQLRYSSFSQHEDRHSLPPSPQQRSRRRTEKTLSDYITDIPECSTAALKTGMEANKCKTSDIGPSTFDCLCTALHIIAPQAAEEITQTCYAGGFYRAC